MFPFASDTAGDESTGMEDVLVNLKMERTIGEHRIGNRSRAERLEVTDKTGGIAKETIANTNRLTINALLY